jgi:glutamate racemase
MSDPRPLGVFDSGIGGLTVLRALKRRLPSEPLLYLGDTARVPYGTRSDETVLRYAREAMAFFLGKGVKAVVVACNTVSAVALEPLAAESSVPVVGVLEPGAAEAVRRTRSGRVGVIGTQATIRSGAYARRIEELHPGAVVMQRACPLFVPLAEEGWLDGAVPRLVAQTYLGDLKRARIDTLVLGCTHYPLLRDVVAGVMGADVALVDSAEAAADEVVRLLAASGLAAPGPTAPSAGTPPSRPDAPAPADHFFVTDPADRFRDVGERFLGGPIERLERVALPVWSEPGTAV